MVGTVNANQIGRTRVSPTFHPMMLLIQELKNTGFFDVQVYTDEMRRMTFKIQVMNQTRTEDMKWKATVYVDDAALTKAPEMATEYRRQLYEGVCQVLKSIPEHLMGKYPATRLYAELHKMGRKGWLFHPERHVEGWLHNRYRGHYPRDELLEPLLNVELEVRGRITDPDDEPDEDDLMDRLTASVFLKTTTALTPKHTEEVKKLATAAKKKKVVNVVKPTIDPSKVKKIKCPKHVERAMVFDPVKQKWKCPVGDCKMTARPVKDEDDRSVQIGKGSTSLRVVADGRDTVVLLVSDDNLALNITPLLNLEEFLRQNGILDLAKTASENGRNEFVDSTERPVQLEMKIGVIGADDLIDNFDD